MTTIHIVSHTHWDREWYLPFQSFRLRLVHLIDNLLAILHTDPDYQHFMLDGQAIVLEDYLELRPEREEEIRQAVQSGRLAIGPWYVLPDEFLVSPEAIVRNLMAGDQVTRRFGRKMSVGYIPDPFGHIAQMPQILQGFGIETAAVARGLDDQPIELWWQSPSGARVLLSYLKDSYGNASHLPASLPGSFAAEVQRLSQRLESFAQTGQVLLLFGTDHTEPSPFTSQAIAEANRILPAEVLHSTLPAYLARVQAEIQKQNLELPVVAGELRSSKRFNLLPGVLSTRMDVKQANHRCENLLERWAEPTSAWVQALISSQPDYRSTAQHSQPADLVQQAWKMLLECHPHDTICGCSVDEVYEDARTRFRAVEKIGETITAENLRTLAGHIQTAPAPSREVRTALVVFNTSPYSQTGLVDAQVELPGLGGVFHLADENEDVVPAEIALTPGQEVIRTEIDPITLQNSLGMVMEGRVADMSVVAAEFTHFGASVEIEFVLTHFSQPNPIVTQQSLETLQALLASPEVKLFRLRGRTATTAHIRFLAKEVPALGYQTFWLKPADSAYKLSKPAAWHIENEFFVVEVNFESDSLLVTDRRTGRTYTDVNLFMDGSDCGDSYNYTPPEQDTITTAKLAEANVEIDELEQRLILHYLLEVPARLSDDRKSRSTETVRIPITSTVRLLPGVARIDFDTEVDNLAEDHRLRVHFIAPFISNSALYDQHFHVIERPLGVPEHDESWQEVPRPEAPQCLFTSISTEGAGLMLANQGLPEVEVIPFNPDATQIALTLLRCTGWLSRDDLSNRKGHAGPPCVLPGAQMPGKYRFAYSLLPHTGDWREAAPLAYAFDLPLRIVATDIHPGALPSSGSLIQNNAPDFVITAVKAAEDGQGTVVRGYNRTVDSIEVELVVSLPYQQVFLARLDETIVEPLSAASDRTICFQAGGAEIITLRLQ